MHPVHLVGAQPNRLGPLGPASRLFQHPVHGSDLEVGRAEAGDDVWQHLLAPDQSRERLAVSAGRLIGHDPPPLRYLVVVGVLNPSYWYAPPLGAVVDKIQRLRHFFACIGKNNQNIVRKLTSVCLEDAPKHVRACPSAGE